MNQQRSTLKAQKKRPIYPLNISLTLCIAAISLLGYGTMTLASKQITSLAQETSSSNNSDSQRIHLAINTFRQINDRYPDQLQILQELGLLLPGDLYYPTGETRFVYTRLDKSYQLTNFDERK